MLGILAILLVISLGVGVMFTWFITQAPLYEPVPDYEYALSGGGILLAIIFFILLVIKM